MSTTVTIAGVSRSFPNGTPELSGDGAVFAGAAAAAAYAAAGPAERGFAAIELGHECLAEHIGLDDYPAHRRTVGFARFRLGNAAPSNLIELVSMPWTDPTAIDGARAAFEDAGFLVARCADTPGRIVGRLIRPYLNAVLRRLDDGLATAADMDKTLRLGLGYPEGPLALLDRTGLAAHHDAAAALYAMTADPDHAPSRRARIAAARLAHEPRDPLVRHGYASTQDPRLVDVLARACAAGLAADEGLVSLLDYDDQLWVTWRDQNARAAGAGLLTRSWAEIGATRGVLHLIPSDEEYDYQEDCMNDASP